jgi:NTP pyrophosphatase (non-canonical NTP hydrolase)
MQQKRLRDLDDLAHTLHARAKAKGFYDPIDNMDEKDYVVFYLKQLAMVHSEVTEVLEAIRKDKGDDLVVEELADIIIRVLDFWAHLSQSGYTNVSIQEALNKKIEVNEKRAYMHGVLA